MFDTFNSFNITDKKIKRMLVSMFVPPLTYHNEFDSINVCMCVCYSTINNELDNIDVCTCDCHSFVCTSSDSS